MYCSELVASAPEHFAACRYSRIVLPVILEVIDMSAVVQIANKQIENIHVNQC